LKSTFLTFLSLCLICIGCNKNDDQGAILAEVGDKKLTINDLMEVIPDNSNSADSIALSERYIQDWIMEQLVINKAEEGLSEDKKNFDLLIENYRKSLLTHTYEQEWIRQKLDTTISEEEIEKYYNDNEKNFQLKDYIVKVKFSAIASDSKNINALKKLFYSEKPEDLVKWEQLCVDIGVSYYFDEDHWMLWDEFIKQVPLEVYDVEAFLKKKKTVELEKDNNLYFIAITDYQLSGSRSPLSFERDKIRSMILNRRKLQLLDDMRRDLYAKATQDNVIKTYFGKK
jgi:hypothetical protein